MSLRQDAYSGEWTPADWHLLAAVGLVLLFTAQRLTGYMSLYLYQRLDYNHLILIAHYLGGAGLVAACTIGSADTPMRLRSVPLIRVIANAGWLVGSLLVLVLWWMCIPAWRPHTPVGGALSAFLVVIAIAALFRPLKKRITGANHARAWKLIIPMVLWQAYSLHWELHLNFLKDELSLTRAGVQWSHLVVDLLATASGIGWALRVQRKRIRGVATP